jgi:hypothetical protein
MDTSGKYPQLANDDPLYEIAAYTQTMKTALSKMGVATWTGSGTINNATVTPLAGITSVAAETTVTLGTLNGTDLTITEAGLYGLSYTFAFTGGASASGRCFVEIAPMNSVSTYATRVGMTSTEDTTAASIAGIYVPAGGKFKFNAYQSTGAAKTYSGVVRVIRFQ